MGVYGNAGLNRELVEDQLPIKQGFRPFKQPARNYNPILFDRIKEEANRLLNAGFIRPCRYVEWVSNNASSHRIISFLDGDTCTIKYSWQRGIFQKLLLDVQAL
jgi:hypothetical protein